MTRRRSLIGIQSFRRLRETNSYYVDKTPFVRDLIDQGDYWFRRLEKAFCRTRSKRCSKDMNRCLRGWIYIVTGTGAPRRTRCCD